MNKPFRYLIAGLCILLGVSILSGIGALWYPHSDDARTRILNALNHRIPGSVSIQRHRFSLMSGRIEIWNLRIMDASLKEAAACEHLSINFSWLQLLRGKLHIQSASISKPKISAELDANGSLNFSHIFSQSASDPETTDAESSYFFPFILDNTTISDASILYSDVSQNLSICLENMNADLSADFLKQAGKTHIRIGSGQISSPFFHSDFGPVSFQGNLEDGQLLPLHLSLLSPGLNADISGSISQIWQAPQLSLSTNLDSALSALRQSFDLKTTLSGLVHITGTISGPLLNPDASLYVTSEQAKISEYSLDRLRMTASLKDRVISLDSFSEPPDKGAIRITGAADLRQAFASGLFSAPVDLSTLSGNLQVLLNSVSLESIHPSATGVASGTLALQCKGYPDHSPKADIGIDLQAARISVHPGTEPVDIRINSKSQWDSNGFRIQHLLAQAGSTRLTAKGFWNSSDNQVSGDLACQSDNLSKSLLPLGIQGTAGSLDIQAGLSGTLDQPECTLKLKSSRLEFREIQLGTLEMDAELGPSGMLRIFTLSLKNQGSELTAKGQIPIYSGKAADSRKHFALTAAFRQIQPVHFLQSPDVQGIIDGNCKLEGTEKSLSGSLQIQAKSLKIQTVRMGNVAGEFQLSKGRIQIQRLFLENQRSHADFSGFVQIFEPAGLSFHRTMPFHLSGAGTALFAEDFTDFLKGKFSMAAELEGTPGEIMGTAVLQSEYLNMGQKTLWQKLTAVELAADFKENRLNISKVHAAVSPGESFNASGWVSLDRTFHFTLAANGISLNHVDALAGNWPTGEGKLFLNLTGNGHLDHPRIQGEVVLNPFRFYNSNWDHTRIELQLADDQARFQVQSPVRGSVSYQFQTRDYAAELDFFQMELSPFFQFAGLAGAGGTVSGKLSASGNFDSLKTLKASAGFSELSLNAKGHPIIEGRDLHLGIQDEAIIIPGNRLTLFQEGTLDIGGEARPGKTVSLRLNADIPMNVARNFDDALSDLRGNLIISAEMKGPWYSPDTEAFMDIRNAGLTLDNVAQDIHDVNGRIHITPRALTIDRIEGQVDSGRITLKGKAEVEAFRIQAMDFQMTASQLPVKIADTLDAKLNADLTLQGTGQAPAIQGEIVVLEGLYYKHVNINPIRSLIQHERGYQGHPEIVFPSAIQNTLLDIRIPPRNLFVVDNNLAQLNLSPDMRITGTLQRPVIQGRTRIDSGSLQYQSTTFTIKKGFIDFTNPYTLESVLDIQSQTVIQNWTVFLDISGPLDKLNLKLSSSPFLDDNDLLSLLITGKTSRAAINKTSDSSASSQKMLADLLSASIGSDLKKASGLDILEVDTTGERRYIHDDPLKVTFGKIISPRITVKYSVETKGGVTFQRAITEYMFIENILLSGFQDSRGVFGGEVKFRHEFR
ncbi:MAG: translocation/assembly module TamB domain-containing protein [Deltaproteobacteria bacterium]|nr:translocation/assembly module TamB domain-containing protein [Deltaproteobacteria bacterium]